MKQSFLKLFNESKLKYHVAMMILMLLSTSSSYAQTWTAVSTNAPHACYGGMLLLSDGTVLCKSSAGGTGGGNTYDRLTPNASGSYSSGTWSSIAPMINTRTFYSTQLLKDGRVYVAGGEYGSGAYSAEVYNPLTNVWTATPAPGGKVSDANSAILEDGRVLQNIVVSSYVGITNKLYNPTTNTFAAGPNSLGSSNEAAWVKLPDNSILYININSTSAERYIPATNTWIADATVPVQLYDSYGKESGGGLLLPDGRVFFIGATGHTAYYTPSGNTTNGTWTAGPDVPSSKGAPDAPCSMMRDGKILMAVSHFPILGDTFPSPTTFYIFDYLTNGYTSITAPDGTPSLNAPCYVTNFVNLPNGQILFSYRNSSQYYVFTPAGGSIAAGVPTVTSIAQTGANTYRITGTKFNGISEGSSYGDDWQMASNYPVIRLVNGSNVYYCRTYNWNSTGVRRGSLPDTTYFTTPASLPTATYSLFVTANGIPSASSVFTPNLVASVNINITSGTNPTCDGKDVTFTASPNNGGVPTYQWKLNGLSISGATNNTYTSNTLLNGDIITCVMTSTISGITGSPATSNPITMVINDNNAVLSTTSTPATICAGATSSLTASFAYCIPTYGAGTSSGDYIGKVQLGSINNITGASASPYFTSFPASGATTTTLIAGSSYIITLSPGSYSGTNRLAAWIDYDQDRSFNVNEKIGQVTVTGAYPLNGTIVFTVPANAENGTTKLRVREAFGATSMDPCKAYTYGETEEYTITIIGGIAASPVTFNWFAGTTPATGSPVTVSPTYSQAYMVSTTDASGCTSSANANVVVNSPNFTASASPVVICGGSSTTINATQTTNTYCQPISTYGSTVGDYISSVAITGTTLNNTTGASASPFYTLYPTSGATTATLTAGTTYTMVLSPGTYGFYNNIAAWIDYDRNSELNNGLEKLGETGYLSASPATGTILFTVPTWAKNGTARLRVREIFATLGMESCDDAYYGETEDYSITITGGVNAVPITYAWSAGTTPSTGSPVTVTPSASSEYTVTATDQYGCTSTRTPDVIVFSPSFTATATPQTICAGATSTLNVTPFQASYCQPSSGNGTQYGDYISNVTLDGTTLNNTTVGAASPYYTLFPAFGATTVTINAGTTYTLTLSAGSYSINNLSAWIDYDQNGTFNQSLEKLGETDQLAASPATTSFVFTVPTWAKNGTVRLRVREVYNTLNIDACSNSNYGETEDYDLTLTGGLNGSVYSWSTGTTPNTGLSVVATPAYSQNYTVTALDDVGCTYSQTIPVVVNSPSISANATPSTLCLGASSTINLVSSYCQAAPINGTIYGDYISSVAIGGTTLNNTSAGAASPYYTLYPASGSTTATLVGGMNYTITLKAGTYTNNDIAAFIDYDQNNSFNIGLEKLGETDNMGASPASTSFTFMVPTWAKNGVTRLRIREMDHATSNDIDPCSNQSAYGETEDYLITITNGSINPAGFTTSWSAGTTPSTGNTVSVTPTFSQAYTVTATDNYGCTATASAPVVVNSVPALSASCTPATICSGATATLFCYPTVTAAYCQPSYSAGTSSGDFISSVSIPGTSLTNTTVGSSTPYYTLYPASGATTATLFAGTTYTLNVGAGTYCCYNNLQAWIDFDQDKSLNSGLEKLGDALNVSGSSVTGIVFTVPTWAKNGVTRLRVRESYGNSVDACSAYNYGETEDYSITISGGVTPVATNYTWASGTTPTTGTSVSATPVTNTTYTVLATDQYGCTNNATVTVNQTTPAYFTNNSVGACLGATTTFNGYVNTCSGNCIVGNGTNIGATLANSYATTAVNNITMEAWLKWNGNTGTNQMIYYNGSSTSNGYGMMLYSANSNRISVICGGVAIMNSTINLAVGAWTHVAAVRNAGTWTLYVNGVANTLTSNTTTPNVPSTIGTNVGKGNTAEYFNGSIDEVRVWNTALSAAQIAANKVGCISYPQAGLVGYWQFNEASGASCFDASGGGRTLTLNNVTARTTSASYAWNLSGGATATGATVNYIYPTTGDKIVTLVVTDITGCAATAIDTLHILPCISTMNLKFYIQGYYTGGGFMTTTLLNEGVAGGATDVDNVTVELRNTTSPYAVAYSFTGILQTNGTITCTFPSSAIGNSYYIAVQHRNALQTWSANPVLMGSTTSYDFSNALNKAYGSNQVLVGAGIYAFFSGDIFKDDVIDGSDVTDIENGTESSAFGYLSADLNGDGSVDGSDYPIWDINTSNSVYSIHP